MLYGVVLAGGVGTRFWPLSRRSSPKQLLPLFQGRSLAQEAFERLAVVAGPERVLVVTVAEHAPLFRDQLPELRPELLVGEPMGRDTAAAIGLSAALLLRRDPEATMIVAPADHLIEPASEFRRAAEAALEWLQTNPSWLVTFGIRPDRPATGYGYLRRGELLGLQRGLGVYRVAEFKEKPPLEVAEALVRSGEYCWNSGIFAWRAAQILGELRRHRPALAEAVCRIAEHWDGPDAVQVFTEEYRGIERVSIDYAVLEKAANVAMVEAPFQWEDLGTWEAFAAHLSADGQGNRSFGLFVGTDTRDCIVYADSGSLVATIGVSNLMVVQTHGVTLVCARGREEEIKQLVGLLEQARLERFL
jgi:mannose-1-phosphate guanylyltransferase